MIPHNNPPFDPPPVLAKAADDARDQALHNTLRALVVLVFVGLVVVALAVLVLFAPSTPARLALWPTGALLVPVVRHLVPVLRSRLAGYLTVDGWDHIGRVGQSAALAVVDAAAKATYEQWVIYYANATTDLCANALKHHRAMRHAVGWLIAALGALTVALVLAGVTR
jgi:hypothetical protein